MNARPVCAGCEHEAHAGACRVLLARQASLFGGLEDVRCGCGAHDDNTRPRMEGFE